MDTSAAPLKPIKVLLELRPALDKYSGIPQQTRLLFRGLTLHDDFAVAGLIQSSTHALRGGLPPDGTRARAVPMDKRINRLSRIVIMLEQRFLRSRFSAVLVALRSLLGSREDLTSFDPQHFHDFIWRRLFAKTLPPADFDRVTGAGFRVARAPWTALNICSLLSGSLGGLLFPRLDTSEFDVMIAETPYPAKVAKQTRLVVRYHDAVPLLMPHTISNRRHHQAFHYRALRQNVASGAWFVCVSEATRKDLVSLFPQVEPRSLTIHNMVSHDYFDEPSQPGRVAEVIKTRLNPRALRSLGRSPDQAQPAADSPTEKLNYLLVVSTIEPRKNHLTLLSAWERLRAERFPGLRLLVVGALGWHHQDILRKYRPWLERGDAFMLDEVPSSELRLLYKHARVTVCPSFAEGFDLSGVEAMMSGGAVVASDIAVHREVYATAAEYFSPYSADDLMRAIRDVIDPAHIARGQELVSLGATIARRYTCEVILPKWQAFLATAPAARAKVR